jgi:homoserine kinase type II
MSTKETDNILEQAKSIVEKYYDIGGLLHIEELHGGYINSSFAVQAKKNTKLCRYVLRKYNPAAAEEKILFEHGFVRHLRENGFDLAAAIIPTIHDHTYVKEQVTAKGRISYVFWALFEFLNGEDRYTWMDTHFSAQELDSCAKVLARLHQAGISFICPVDTDRALPKIMDFLATFRQTYTTYSRNAGTTPVDQFLLDNRDAIYTKVDQAIIADGDLTRMPQIPIHGDYHQGNLKYEGSRVIGVFDFDWSKIDLRLFDLGQALLYFCTRWEGRQAGSMNLDTYVLFLKSYNENCTSAAGPGPLTVLEKAYLPSMLQAANLFVLQLIIDYFYLDRSPDIEEYLNVFHHRLKTIDWIEAQTRRIGAETDMACSPTR